jgi:hypothetical protein
MGKVTPPLYAPLRLKNIFYPPEILRLLARTFYPEKDHCVRCGKLVKSLVWTPDPSCQIGSSSSDEIFQSESIPIFFQSLRCF